jgi:hypothetical protein
VAILPFLLGCHLRLFTPLQRIVQISHKQIIKVLCHPSIQVVELEVVEEMAEEEVTGEEMFKTWTRETRWTE